MTRRQLTIGRDRGADIPMADSSVSRLHAEVAVVEGDRLFVTDCRSSNGTFVIRKGVPNRIQQETVRGGEHLQFGEVIIAVSDLLDVARQKLSGSRPAGAPGPKPLPKSEKLVRCECGTIKEMGTLCPFCNQ